LQSKSNSRKIKRCGSTFVFSFLVSAAKVTLFCEPRKYFAGNFRFALTFRLSAAPRHPVGEMLKMSPGEKKSPVFLARLQVFCLPLHRKSH
jgi:hypothetical protein